MTGDCASGARNTRSSDTPIATGTLRASQGFPTARYSDSQLQIEYQHIHCMFPINGILRGNLLGETRGNTRCLLGSRLRVHDACLHAAANVLAAHFVVYVRWRRRERTCRSPLLRSSSIHATEWGRASSLTSSQSKKQEPRAELSEQAAAKMLHSTWR
eukprot:6197566-Pleurochrysis_carterae.AAC.8